MNNDHPDDNLLIVRAFGQPDATSATMVGLDENGGQWSATTGDDARAVTVAWSGPISQRAEIRREIVVLYDAACERLGLTPREH